MSCTLDLDRGHTLDELLRGCIDAFDAQGKVRDPHLVRLFLMMHPWYLPPAELADKLLRIIEESGGSAEGPSLRLKISHLVRYWVRAFPGELAGDPELLGRIRALREALGRGAGGDPATHIDLDSLPALPGGEQEEPPPQPPAQRKTSLLLDHLEAAELAEHLTHLEHRAFARVRVSAPRPSQPSRGPLPRTPSCKAHAGPSSIARPRDGSPPSHALVQGPHGSLLHCTPLARVPPPSHALVHGGPVPRRGARRRARAACPQLQDYRSFARRGCAAGSPALQRVVALSNGVSRWVQLLVLSPAAPPQRARVLTRFLHVAQRLLELRNFNTLMAVVGGLGHGSITRLHQTLALLPPDVTKLWARLSAVSLELGQTEEQLYQLSLQREPRTRPPSGPPPALPPACPMDEWVLPAPPRPDPALLRAHLEQLVESIFRNFDVDGDGRISREEFGIVRENFPQLQLFGDLDTDRDGSLSRGEVLASFLRCGQGPPPGPPHRFEESSPLRPAACRHCRRPILGLHKQGLKCRTCGLRCHARCRERLRVECRRRTQSVAAEAPPGPPPRSFSFSLPWPRRASLHPPETPPELQEVEDGVFDIHL